jgi:hypothetical protein
MDKQTPSWNDVVKLQEQLKDAANDYWMHHTLFTWQWWVLLILTFLPWIIWWKIVNKQRIGEYLYFGVLIAIMTTTLDSIGSSMMWWVYPHQLIRILPPLVPVDLSIIPCLMMVIYQVFSQWKTYLLANIAFAFLASYLFEPLFVWSEIYDMITWNYFYSVLFYVVAGSISRWIVTWTLSRIGRGL